MLKVMSLFLACCLSVVAVRNAPAMTMEQMDFDRLLDEAQEIYQAQVVSVTCDWSGEGANRHIATFVRLRVLASFRGAVQGEQVLEFFGGRIGERTQRIVGMPGFQPGDMEIVFVRDNHRVLCPLVGAYFGRLRVVRNAADGREQIFLNDGAPLTDVSLIGKEPAARAKTAATNARGEPTRPLSTKEFAGMIKDGLKRRGISPDEP
ncbi:hypothetical protein AYO41_04470 [Verrucomicrobia bacterium SCGC AG-212-E04]|nr:hypothetical protein AYO41_04470 [Verrucomicrobia bacterium SCGC AG-212-E04]